MKYTLVAAAILTLSAAVDAETLNDAVQHGLITNPDVLYNTAEGLTYKQGIDKAKGAYFPSIDFNAGYGREQSQNPTTAAIAGGTGKATLNRTESNIELRENLFSGGEIINEVKRNEHKYQAQRLKTQGVAEDMTLEIVRRYLGILLTEKLYQLSVQNLSAHRAVYGTIKQRSESGLSLTAEVDQANARLALAEANRISAEANLREAKISYAKVVGNWPGKLSWPRVPTNRELPPSLAIALERGLDHHPTIKSTYADIKEAKSQYDVARAAYYPKFDFVLSASQNKNLDGLVGPNNDRMAMVRMHYNLFRGGSDEANVRLTAYQVQESYEVKNKALIDMKEAVRLSWNSWKASSMRLNPLNRHVSASLKTRSAYQEQFKVGKRTLLDLLDSQNELYESQINLAKGVNDEVLSRYRILNSMGRLLPYLHMKIPQNVVNNDIFSSAQTHVLLDKSMDHVPFPDTTQNDLMLNQPVKSMDTTRLTQAIINKNTAAPELVSPLVWYVSAGVFKSKPSALALLGRLKGLGFTAFINPKPEGDNVLIGPYEYRGHAANGMERLKEVAHVQGMLVTFKHTEHA